VPAGRPRCVTTVSTPPLPRSRNSSTSVVSLSKALNQSSSCLRIAARPSKIPKPIGDVYQAVSGAKNSSPRRSHRCPRPQVTCAKAPPGRRSQAPRLSPFRTRFGLPVSASEHCPVVPRLCRILGHNGCMVTESRMYVDRPRERVGLPETRDPVTGHTWVFYQGTNHELWETYEPGTGWGAQQLDYGMALGTSPQTRAREVREGWYGPRRCVRSCASGQRIGHSQR
jgi:hypothetical protein